MSTRPRYDSTTSDARASYRGHEGRRQGKTSVLPIEIPIPRIRKLPDTPRTNRNSQRDEQQRTKENRGGGQNEEGDIKVRGVWYRESGGKENPEAAQTPPRRREERAKTRRVRMRPDVQKVMTANQEQAREATQRRGHGFGNDVAREADADTSSGHGRERPNTSGGETWWQAIGTTRVGCDAEMRQRPGTTRSNSARPGETWRDWNPSKSVVNETKRLPKWQEVEGKVRGDHGMIRRQATQGRATEDTRVDDKVKLAYAQGRGTRDARRP
ncbi:hypothetical protein C8F04DRAFT_1230735 [Mycena alexandri]|uniref:Uncharacterized protein n=1 Tax=Mycena alexandri TaxID=1745969 RepID=A0AAD6T6E4_9AGAR|nr:hypothetical protein C8F04DRAFT_1230735 [Mycena alexandri]